MKHRRILPSAGGQPVTYIENANSVRTAYVYDAFERTSTIYLDADKNGTVDDAEAQVSYLYASGRLSGIDTATTDYSLTYDSFGNILTIKAGNNTLATYEYAANNGKLLELTYGNGDYEEYFYDSLERLYQVKFNGTVEYTLKYDGNGRLYSMTEGNTTHIYEYDSLDRLIRAWQKDSNGNNVVAVENTYDSLGRATGSTYVVNGKEMSYDITYKADSSLVASVGMPDANASLMSAINYTYDNFERLTTKNVSLSTTANLYEDYTYYTYTGTDDKTHTTALVSSVTLRISSGGTTTSTVYSYTYDNLGNITIVSKDGVAQANYGYDNLGQLVTEIDRVANKVYSYSYDKAGNILSKTTYDFSTANVLGSVSYTYSDSAWGDLLTNYNGTTINYDAIGNPTNWRNASSLTWDARQLAGLTLSNEDSFTYTYNSAGIRTQKQYYDFDYCGYYTYDYVLDGTNIISETVHRDNTKLYTLYYLYDESGSVQGFIYNNAYYYYQKNLQRDVVRIVNAAGTVVVEYTYDAWGNILSVTGSLADTIGHYNPFRYRSYYYDAETGWYYLQSRYYDPVVGRFLNEDDATMIGANGTVVGHNIFAYSNNNPVMFTDPAGYDAIVLGKTDGVLQHMGALIQDEEGNWWHFYWGMTDKCDAFYVPCALGLYVPANAWCIPYEGELNLNAINASKQYDSYNELVYLTGDFSSVVDKAKSLKGFYNLYGSNCAHVTLSLLEKAGTNHANALRLAKRLPTIYHSMDLIQFYDSIFDHNSSIESSLLDGIIGTISTVIASTSASVNQTIFPPSNSNRYTRYELN